MQFSNFGINQRLASDMYHCVTPARLLLLVASCSACISRSCFILLQKNRTDALTNYLKSNVLNRRLISLRVFEDYLLDVLCTLNLIQKNYYLSVRSVSDNQVFHPTADRYNQPA